MLYFSHVEVEVQQGSTFRTAALSPDPRGDSPIGKPEEQAFQQTIEEYLFSPDSKKRKRRTVSVESHEASDYNDESVHDEAEQVKPEQKSLFIQEYDIGNGTDTVAQGPNPLEQINRSLEDEIAKLQGELRDLRSQLDDECTTSLARKNANNDLQLKLQGAKEVENLLRVELKDVTSEHLDLRAKDARNIEQLRQVQEKMRKELFEAVESSNEAKAKTRSLQADLRKVNAELTEIKAQVQTHVREVKRKDDYISELHRDIDRQGIEARKLEHHLEVAKKEVDSRQARYKELEYKFHKLERDNAARLIKSHSEVEEKHRARENELLRRIYTLEEGINGGGGPKQSTTLELLNILAKTGGKTDTSVEEVKLVERSDVTAERDALLVAIDDLQKRYEAVKEDLDKAQASPGHSDAYLKLLKSNELLQKENILLKNKVQDEATGVWPEPVTANGVDALTATVDRQAKELEALRRSLEQERARAERLAEQHRQAAAVSAEANDAWSTQF